MPYFNFQDQKLFFQITESKSNKAIIFIHGSGEGSQIWKNQLELDLDYNLIALDLPSHFNSDYYSKVSLGLYLDAVIALVDHLRYQEVILCGHSLGGAIAQAYYFKYPRDLKALILIATGARLRVSPNILEATKDNFQQYLDWIPSGAFYRKTPEDVVQEYVNDTAKMKPMVTFADYKICDLFDTLNNTHKINLPCLIICGDKDILTPPKYSKYFKEKIKNSKLEIIKKAGHLVMLEQPEEVNEAIVNFVSKL